MKKTILILPLMLLAMACSHQNETQIQVKEDNYISEEDMARYRSNIVEKRRGPSYVSYEYKDVRIDEITPLAVNYCKQKNGGNTAHLREIIMRENHLRLATFDCVPLQ